MIKIAITRAAFEAIDATLPFGSVEEACLGPTRLGNAASRSYPRSSMLDAPAAR